MTKYEPFFAELERDSKKTQGISILHYQNPVSKMNDVTMVVFDLRIFQQELGQQAPDYTPSILDAVGQMGIKQAEPFVGQQIEEQTGAQVAQGLPPQ